MDGEYSHQKILLKVSFSDLRKFWPWRVLVVMDLIRCKMPDSLFFCVATPWISQGEVIPSRQGMTEQTSRLGYVITVCLNPFKTTERQRMNPVGFFPHYFVFVRVFFYWRASTTVLSGKVQFVEGRDVPFFFFLELKTTKRSHRARLSPNNRLFSCTWWSDLIRKKIRSSFCFFRWTESKIFFETWASKKLRWVASICCEESTFGSEKKSKRSSLISFKNRVFWQRKNAKGQFCGKPFHLKRIFCSCWKGHTDVILNIILTVEMSDFSTRITS